MIYLYSGTPGSGKSLHTASLISWRLKKNLPIIANFEVDTTKVKHAKGEFFYVDNVHLTPDYIINFSLNYWNGKRPKEESILVIIDEAQLMFNARDWSAKGRAEWLSFFTQHRKYGVKVVLVAQFDRMLDRQIRSVIQFEYKHIKLRNYGWQGWLLSFWCFGNLFQAKQYEYSSKTKIDCMYYMARKKYYSLYDTYNLFTATRDEGSGESSRA